MSKASKKAENRFRSLIDIGTALTAEKELQKILDLILQKCIETIHADRAYIYLTEAMRIDSIGNNKKKFLSLLKLNSTIGKNRAQKIYNKVIDHELHSVASYVSQTGHCVKQADLTKIGAHCPYKHANDDDEKYLVKNVLAVPIINSDGKIRGVLQLANKLGEKSNLDSMGFTFQDEELLKAYASQALVAMENARLNEDIENLFESFIRASVTAIEARDPATSGHSDRVAVLTVEFARSVHMSTSGTYKNVHFTDQQMREIRYASLLHDFGKIGVSESILQKEKKLFPHELETILLRLDTVKARKEAAAWKELTHELIEAFNSPQNVSPKFKLAQLEKKLERFSHKLHEVRTHIMSANQPQVIAKDFDITKLMGWIHELSGSLDQVILTPEEMIRLSVPKGTLNAKERSEIESHVSHTYKFLRQIAWTEDLSNVAEIAHAHHEKLDGSGYPRGLTQESIPLQSRIMAIADIYDALTSMDRPYKPALPTERALDILHNEAHEKKIDVDLLKIFIEAGVFMSVEGMRRRRAA